MLKHEAYLAFPVYPIVNVDTYSLGQAGIAFLYFHLKQYSKAEAVLRPFLKGLRGRLMSCIFQGTVLLSNFVL